MEKVTPEATVAFEKEEMTEEQREQFLNGNPTRKEVANFIGGYVMNEVVPNIIDYVNQKDNHNLALISVCQAVLVSQGIISKEEMDALMKNWENNQDKPKTPIGVVK